MVKIFKKKKLMFSKKKALVDLPKDMAGPKSPEDPFQFLLPWGFSYRLFEGRRMDPFFINMLLKDSVDELNHLPAGCNGQV